MDAEKQREIARKGGRAAHEKGTAHEFDSDEARAAGRKGGEVVSQNREHMAEIGAKGGHASHSNRAAHATARSRGQRGAMGMTGVSDEPNTMVEDREASTSSAAPRTAPRCPAASRCPPAVATRASRTIDHSREPRLVTGGWPSRTAARTVI
ncbi:KGG domain-containing protein [Nannocystis pusilla]|uniref:KGG domain-containing protein n=1 Tax=Nannocystis pusilla TaxID=889268 RepID=UPI003B7DC4E3